MRLESKTAIVTGAANGIGRAIAQLFAKEGAQVVVCDIDVDAATRVVDRIKGESHEGTFVQCDVSRRQDVERLVDITIQTYGKLDILVNNAACWKGDGNLLDVEESVWHEVVDGSLGSMYLCMKQAIPRMAEAKQGAIVNISSVNALFGINLAAYTAAKGGVVALTRLVATQYGGQGIRANVICPGTIETESTKEYFQAKPEEREKYLKPVPLKRLGLPKDIAHCALYLASPESDFVTGAVFVVDGGLTAGVQIDA